MNETKTRVAREHEKGGNPARYYRKQYIKLTKISKLSQDFDIHHLDHNWKNDKPANLVALPKAVHDLWHRFKEKGACNYSRGRFFVAANLHPISLRNVNKVIEEISRWIDYRDYLLGTIGLNLHSLSYE